MEKDQEEGARTHLANPKPRGRKVVWSPGITHVWVASWRISTHLRVECKPVGAWAVLI